MPEIVALKAELLGRKRVAGAANTVVGKESIARRINHPGRHDGITWLVCGRVVRQAELHRYAASQEKGRDAERGSLRNRSQLVCGVALEVGVELVIVQAGPRSCAP